MRDVIIIGSGPAGYAAAIYAARANLNPILYTGDEPGGQLMTTTDVENYPGYPGGILGPVMMEDFKKQAARFGADIRSKRADALTVAEDGSFTVTARTETETASSVILAMGASALRLGLESEKALYGKGVSACATCDGFFFKEKNVIVVGGGDSAMEESIFLTRFAKKVYIVHRREAFRASKIMQKRVLEHPKIEVIWNTEVDDILGVDVGKVTGVRLRSTQDGTNREMPIDGVFAAIGHTPNSDIVKGILDLDEKGYVLVEPGSTKTKVAGLFACGDLTDPHYRQAVTAAGTGCMAALDAERYLSGS